MEIDWEKIAEKAHIDLESLTPQEIEVFNWVQCFMDGSMDNWRLEEHVVFEKCRQDVLIWRLRFERDYWEKKSNDWYLKYKGIKTRYQTFIEVCREIFGRVNNG